MDSVNAVEASFTHNMGVCLHDGVKKKNENQICVPFFFSAFCVFFVCVQNNLVREEKKDQNLLISSYKTCRFLWSNKHSIWNSHQRQDFHKNINSFHGQKKFKKKKQKRYSMTVCETGESSLGNMDEAIWLTVITMTV